MGVKDQVARPSMQDPDHADLSADEVRVFCQLLCGLGRGLKQEMIKQLLVLSGGVTQFLWQGKGQHEIGNGQQEITL